MGSFSFMEASVGELGIVCCLLSRQRKLVLTLHDIFSHQVYARGFKVSVVHFGSFRVGPKEWGLGHSCESGGPVIPGPLFERWFFADLCDTIVERNRF